MSAANVNALSIPRLQKKKDRVRISKWHTQTVWNQIAALHTVNDILVIIMHSDT